MTNTVNVQQARNQLPQLMEQAHAGRDVILAKAGKPYARLVPLALVKPRRQPGRLQGKLAQTFFDPLPDDAPQAWSGR